ncbi:hypothetical protein DFH09DRAFT_1280226 [Mycena vulgaris]|nr:hypothetical protein DFH09DRAFT_1280226 [Mycena vulgaris]
MLSPLAFSPTTLAAHWMDSPLTFASPAFDLPLALVDAGRQFEEVFDSPHVHYPVLPLDGDGEYRSPKVAFMKQVAANKKDPLWKETGAGLGLGLTGVTKHCGVLQSNYVLSRRPEMICAVTTEPAIPSSPPTPAAQPDSAGSLWDALTDFLDTTYSLLSPPDSPVSEAGGAGAAAVQCPAADFIVTEPTVVAPTPLPSSPLDAVSSPPQMLALAPIVLTPPASPIKEFPASPQRTLVFPTLRNTIPKTFQSPVQQSPRKFSAALCTTKSPVSFAVEARGNRDERSAWFAREEALADKKSTSTPWDRRRLSAIAHEETLAVHPRFTMRGVPYAVVLRQRTRSEEERAARCSRWLKREEQIARAERGIGGVAMVRVGGIGGVEMVRA